MTLSRMTLSRLPIRVRLALLFCAIMAVVLLATGAFLHWRLGSTLDSAIDEGLENRFEELATVVSSAEETIPDDEKTLLGEEGETVVQILSSDGEVLYQSGGVSQPLLSPEKRNRRPKDIPSPIEEYIPETDNTFRLLAGGVSTPGETVTLIVGRSTESRREALDNLVAQLALGGPLVLVISSILAYVLAAAALRPVESMRREAEAIGTTSRSGRLPTPPARDEISRLGETLNEMLARLEESINRERAFVADAAHELRTPLALLRMELDLALSRARSKEELEEALRSAAAESERLSRLAEDLLVLARADQKRLALEYSTFTAHDLFRSVAERSRARTANSSRSLHIEASEGMVVTADRRRLEQALDNLVENAFRYGEGPVTLWATQISLATQTSSATQPSAVELHVLDQGPGFGTAPSSQLFERFVRADTARSDEGTGLGLSIVRAIAETHGGTAAAANRPQGGGDVYITLPLEEVHGVESADSGVCS